MHVTVWDRTLQPTTITAGERVRAAASAAEATREADAVVTVLLDAEAVLSVMREQGAFNATKAGSTWLQMSTIGVEGTEQAMLLAATRPEIANWPSVQRVDRDSD
jgi:3-hydroxyisobutyrate dehydrogenase